jgi:hypothetical protein
LRDRGWRARGEEKRARVRWPAPFEAEAGEAGEGWGSGVRRHVEEKMGQREGAVVRRRGPARHRRGGSGLLRQRRAYVVNRGGRWRARRGTVRLIGRPERRRGPVAAAGVRVAGRASGAVQHGPADWRARQHNAAQFGFKPNQKYFKRIQNSPNFD